MAHGHGGLWHDFKHKLELPDDMLSLNGWVGYAESWVVSRALFLWSIYIGLLGVAALIVPNFGSFAAGWLLGTAPIWAPIVLAIAAYSRWVWYVHAYFIAKMDPILMEIKIPREITKSARAMEMVFTHFWYSSGEVTFIARAWKGSVRPYFSFEICSFGGEIHFYVWARRGYKRVVESALYAQYPEIEIVEVEDYSKKFVYDPAKYQVFAGEYWKFTDKAAAQDSVFPLKTYVDFELDKDPKEEFKVDPLAQVFEVLSALKPTEQAWIQFVIRQNSKDEGVFFPRKSEWTSNVKKKVQQIRKEASINPGKEGVPESQADEKKKYGFPRPTWVQQEQIKALERSLTKYAYDVGGRHLYIAEKKDFSGAVATAIRWIWKPFNNHTFGAYMRSKYWHNDLDYPWQDWKGIRSRLMTRRALDAYRRRSFYHAPWIMPWNVMTVEELATIWRFPSSTIKSPGIRRIPSARSEPPANLPK